MLTTPDMLNAASAGAPAPAAAPAAAPVLPTASDTDASAPSQAEPSSPIEQVAQQVTPSVPGLANGSLVAVPNGQTGENIGVNIHSVDDLKNIRLPQNFEYKEYLGTDMNGNPIANTRVISTLDAKGKPTGATAYDAYVAYMSGQMQLQRIMDADAANTRRKMAQADLEGKQSTNEKTKAETQGKLLENAYAPTKQAQETAESKAKVGHENAETAKLRQDIAQTSGTGGAALTGEAFLATLPAGRQAQVRAIGEGRQELTPSMLRTKDGQALSQQVNQAYPDFQQGNSSAYVKLRNAFTSGKEAAGINSLNTVETHLARMYDHAGQAHTSGGLTGRVTGFFGDKDVLALKADQQAVATELAKAYAQGQISEKEVNDWKERLDPTAFGQTTAKLRTSIQEIDALLEGKQNAYQSQWENGVPKGVPAPITIINSDASAARARIRGQGGPSTTPSTPAAPAQAPAALSPAAQAYIDKHKGNQ